MRLRMRHREQRTMAYFERRRAEGLTTRDIVRCLERHVANGIYTALLNRRQTNQPDTKCERGVRNAGSRSQRPRRRPRCPLRAATPT